MWQKTQGNASYDLGSNGLLGYRADDSASGTAPFWHLSQEPLPDANGVYEAKVEMKAPDGRWIAKTTNGGTNTMFPKHWDAARVAAEIESAWNSTDKTVQGNTWSGTSVSGVTIEGYTYPRATAYPIHGGKSK